MNVHSLPPLLGAIANPILGLFVFLRNRNGVNKVFMGLCLVVGLWNVHEFGLYIAPHRLFAIYWGRVFGLGLMLIPPVFLHFTMKFIGDKAKRTRWIISGGYLIAIVFVVFFWSGLLVKDYFFVVCQYFPRPTWVYNSYIIFFLTVATYGLIRIFLQYQKTGQSIQRIRYRFFLMAILLAVVIGTTNFLVSFGVRIYPIGHLGGITFTSITAWALARYS